MPRGRLILWTTIALAGLGGCATAPIQNGRLDHFSPRYGYRFENIAPGDGNSDSLFVVLTFSGGGTRAASFSFGVLEKLRDVTIRWEGRQRRLLDEVDVISSVSGGSLTAAYYGLFGDRIFEEFTDKVLYKPVQNILLRKLLGLKNYIKLASPFYGRTDLMAEAFDADIFEKRTFADLLAGNRRPFIIINATDMSLGRRFAFTQDHFDLLYSDLGTYPVGHAVAASAAYPGFLTPVTLRNYDNASDYQLPGWTREQLAHGDPDKSDFKLARDMQSYVVPGRPYVHLIDGGVCDNLGLLPVIRALHGTAAVALKRPVPRDGRPQKVVVITVNAARKVPANWDQRPHVVRLAGVLNAVSSTPIVNFSQAQMDYLDLFIEKQQETRRIVSEFEDLLCEKCAKAALPGLADEEIDYRFIEVAFERVGDEGLRAELNEIPTTFRLPRGSVDKLRKASAAILDNHPVFQQLVAELQ